jgi:hypothetical protein
MILNLYTPTWLDKVTVSKIDIILGSSFKNALLAQTPEEILPTDFGTCDEEGTAYIAYHF